ncbi:MAG TPA: alkaline phosphatase D family protein [Chitinophagales bacterium]|nr:alkaline phosphatase D family protein [Chitinophagales bacterium]HQO89259.1 alkaline phosphatase D family protein [Chitinophagales bacterium]
MKKSLLVLLLSCVTAIIVQAQPNDYTNRSALDASLAPFYHGVASGDPTPNAVIIWTRVTPDIPGDVNGTWQMATDTAFSNIVKSGTFTTDSSIDYTVKIDVTGLQPDTWYFYEFAVAGRNSLTGRTKTTPAGGRSQLRFAFVSCADYPAGYYNAYDAIWKRNDIDAVLHLGDYIYEYKDGVVGTMRQQLPDHEIIQLADYRLRHSTIKLDTMLMRLHQQFPFITTWDDHETANNSYRDGAGNHSPNSEGPWSVRKAAGQQAYDEWMPMRLPEAGNPNKIFRKISYGNLADIFMLDTRLYARTEQNNNFNDTSKHIIGDEQLEWLKNEMINSTATWKILGQQVMMGQLTPFGITLNKDQWDGYTADRKKLYDIILNNNIQNVIVLTGDIHTAWAMDLPYNTTTYNANTGAGSVGVEFVCTSITTQSSPIPLEPVYDLIKVLLPHIKYVDLYKKGFGILDLTPAQAQGNFYSISRIDKVDTTTRYETGFYTLPSTRWLKKAATESPFTGTKQFYAPFQPRTSVPTSIYNNPKNIVMLSAYPNPFIDKVFLQYNLFQPASVKVELYDMTGRKVKETALGIQSRGLHIEALDFNDIARGTYRLLLRGDGEVLEQSVQKF